jgi:hypothetical protein
MTTCLIRGGAMLAALYLLGAAPATRPAFRAGAKADAVLHRAADFYASARTLSADFACSATTEARGRKGERSSASTLRLQRPNKVAVVLRKCSDARFAPATVVSDGRELYECVPIMRSYAVTPAPATLDEVIEPLNIANLTMGGSETWGLVRAFASSRPYEKMTAEVASARYVGTEEVGGVRADRIELVWAGARGPSASSGWRRGTSRSYCGSRRPRRPRSTWGPRPRT